MTPNEQRDIEQQIAASLQDAVLSRDEESVLRSAVSRFEHDDNALGFMRNTAFKLAATEIEAKPTEVLRWLNKVDRSIDRATRNGGPQVHEVAFAPGKGCRDLVIRHLKSAKQSVDICVFTVTDDRIRDQILSAKARGVTVHLVTDDIKATDDGSDTRWLAGRGVAVRTDDHPNHMHHKFAIIDRRVLVMGSFNWTRGGSRNHENIIATDDAALVEAFGDEFERLWEQFQR